jgi:biofilm PGA synthesis lipoprotein PgaB
VVQQEIRGVENILKQLALWVGLAGGLLFALPGQALVILQYHHISNQTPAATSTSPEQFEAHLRAIAESGYQVVDLASVTRLLRNGDALPDQSVLITFDDSYPSIFDKAFPLLRERGWPFVILTNTEPVDLGLQGFLSWDQLRLMSKHGAAIANHSVSHPHMIRHRKGESAKQWRQRMSAEILDAERRIKQEIGQDHKVFAYPYGEFSAELQALLASLDYTGLGQHSGAASRDQGLALPRFALGGAYGEPEDFALKLRALPLSLQSVTLHTESGETLRDGVLPVAVTRPRVRLQPSDSALLEKLQCYVSLQGRASKSLSSSGTAEFQADQALRVGRARYNCTAPSADSSRFHWYSVPFIRRHPNGDWQAEP